MTDMNDDVLRSTYDLTKHVEIVYFYMNNMNIHTPSIINIYYSRV